MNELILSAGEFNHCSTLVAHNGNILVAWYAGTKECADDQSVFVSLVQNGVAGEPLRIGDKTGNPVLFCHEGKHLLLYSLFEQKTDHPVHRWRHCSLWLGEIGVNNGHPFLAGTRRISTAGAHLLGRCLPDCFNNKMVIPLYDELEGKCCVGLMDYSGGVAYSGLFGNRMIQPALFVQDDILHAVCRNFCALGERSPETICARYCTSLNGMDWSAPRPCCPKDSVFFPNWNSSLAIESTDEGDVHFVVWNDTQDRQRLRLTLGKLEVEPIGYIKPQPLMTITEGKGHYPSLLVCSNSVLVSYTGEDRKIHVVDCGAQYELVKE